MNTGKLDFKERYLKALRREPIDRVPVPSFCTHPLIALMEHTGLFPPNIHDSLKEMVNFALAGYEVLGLEGIRLPTDGVIEAEAMGCKIEMGDINRNPFVVGHPFDLNDFDIPENFLKRGRIPLLIEAVETVKNKVADEIPVTTHFMGPTTIACHLVQMETFLKGLVKKQDATAKLLNSLTDMCIQIGNALAEAGADVLEFPDPMASPSVMSPRMFEEFVLPCYQKIFRNISCPIVLHICGKTDPILPIIEKSGAIGFSFDAMVSVSHAREILSNNMSLVGNISAIDTLLYGSKEKINRETINAIRAGINVVAPSCGFAPRTPLKNIKEMIRSAKRKIEK